MFQWRSTARRKEKEDDFSFARELRDREKRLQALEEQLEQRARLVPHLGDGGGAQLTQTESHFPCLMPHTAACSLHETDYIVSNLLVLLPLHSMTWNNRALDLSDFSFKL